MTSTILEFKNVSKHFAGIRALNDVSFSVRQGEIHAIVGENGAGKSTLMKIVSGFYPQGDYDGSVLLNGQEIQFKRINDSEDAGVAIIYQEFALVPKLSVIDNIFLGHEIRTSTGSIDMIAQDKKTRELLNQIGLEINPFMAIEELGVGQQQLVEIAKAINRNARIIIFDEPTAALNDKESKQLLDLIREFKSRNITCLYVSHKLEEVLDVSDRLTVLRDGCTVTTEQVKDNQEMNEGQIISYMVGRTIENRFPWIEKKRGDVVFEIKNWTVPHPVLNHKNALDNVNLAVHKGEIVGLGGLMGAGRTELALSLLGLYEKPISGEIFIDGKKERINSPSDANSKGLCYLTEDRKGKGLILYNSVKKNITLASLRQFSNHTRIETMKEETAVQNIINDLRIKTSSQEQLVVNLSGGNQQKVVLAKCLMVKPKILILDEPTRGIDVGAKFEIYELINRLTTKEGMGILMITSELPELLGVCDRIVIMHEGTLTGNLVRKDVTPELFMKYATGGK